MTYSNGKSKQILSLWAALLASAVVFANCGKPLPVRNLTEARAELDEAQKINAEELAAEKYKSSREALLSAHQLLVDEEVESAAKKADEARNLGLDAREEAAPKYGDNEKKKTESALNEADEAYAEVLGKDDFLAAQKLYKDGSGLLQEANGEKKSDASIDARHAVLDKYKDANNKFAAAQEAARKAKNTALAQKDDLMESLSGVQRLLNRADMYRAQDTVPDLYKTAQNEVNEARKSIEAGKLKKGNGQILKAEELARAVLQSAQDKYAAQKKAEAAAVVNKAEEELNKEKTADVEDEELKTKISRIKETLSAAKEARGAAEKNYSDRKYEDSIKDSEEAIRLGKIVLEQIPDLQRAIARKGERKMVVVDKNDKTGKTDKTAKTDKSDKTAKTDKTDKTAKTDKTEKTDKTDVSGQDDRRNWKRYVVKKKDPADCLWRIAGYGGVYGNAKYWKKIWWANRRKIRNPNLIYPGQVFEIPPKNYDFRRKPATNVEKKEEEKKTEEKKEEKKDVDQPRENIE